MVSGKCQDSILHSPHAKFYVVFMWGGGGVVYETMRCNYNGRGKMCHHGCRCDKKEEVRKGITSA